VSAEEQLEVRATSAARSNVALSPLISLAAFASSVVVVRALDPEVFALCALALAIRASVQFLVDLGTGAASARTFAELQAIGARRQALRLYRRLAAIRAVAILALTAIVLVGSDQIASLLSLEDDERYFIPFALALAALEIASTLGFYTLNGLLRHGVSNKITLSYGVLQPTLVIAVAAAGFGLRGVLTAMVIASWARAFAAIASSVRAVSAIAELGGHVERLVGSYARVATSSLIGKVAGWVHSRQFVTPVVFSSVPRSEVASYSLTYDWVHQILTVVSGPFYSLLLPVFAARVSAEQSVRRLFDLATRGVALVTLPAAAVFLAVFPSLAAVLLPEGYQNASDYAAILIPFFALEVVLSGPATAVMLAVPRLAGAYAAIKVATLLPAAFYLVASGVDLRVVTAVMMGVRVASAVALHAAVWRRTGLHVDLRWLVFALGVALLVAVIGIAAGLAVPGRALDLVLVPVAALAAYLALVRVVGLLRASDVELARAIVPFSGRALRPLSRW
jgi:O-antigen/teichoic acid export membrane protein